MNMDHYNFYLKHLINGTLKDSAIWNVDQMNQNGYIQERHILGVSGQAEIRVTTPEFKAALKDYVAIKDSPVYTMLREDDEA